MDTSLYINQIEEHLADTTTYKELNSDPIKPSERMPSPPSITFTSPTE